MLRSLRRFLARATDGTIQPDRYRALDAIGLAGFDERVEICAGMGTGHRVAEQPIAATDDKRAYGVFAEVVINRPGAVFNKADQFRPVKNISKKLSDRKSALNQFSILFEGRMPS